MDFNKSIIWDELLALGWWEMLIMLLGGMAIFLYGIDKMARELQKISTSRMQNILMMVTNNRFLGMLSGTLITAVVQSSSATTVMLVGLVQAGLIKFSQTLGVILGADIGTTVTVQLMALKISDYALLLVFIGFVVRVFSERRGREWYHLGNAILGCGLLFFGMKLMSDAMIPLQKSPDIIAIIRGAENPLWGIFISALITALIHSSAATIGMVIVLGQQNLLSLDACIPLIMGANIGTCVTAIIASWRTNRDAQRVAIAHVFFKIGGVLLFVTWIPSFAKIVHYLSTNWHFVGMQSVGNQVANAHTIFNVALALVFLPFTTIMGRLLLKFYPDIPDQKVRKGLVFTAKHLDIAFLHTPNIAIDLARLEIARMAKVLGNMLFPVIIPFIGKENIDDPQNLVSDMRLYEEITYCERETDFLEKQISNYLLNIGSEEISTQQSNEIYTLLSISKDLESIGDIINKNIFPLLEKKRRLQVHFSLEGCEELRIYHDKVCKQIARLEKIFSTIDPPSVKQVISKMKSYVTLEGDFRRRHLERVHLGKKESIATHQIHMELMDYLKQINVYTGNIAKSVKMYQEMYQEMKDVQEAAVA
ncbi:MAG: Na/Pi cotransporter family protein [Oligoflexia bacterium]|nr:Na/Pi cotransporter family protein [Oligoflexia bacterium]